ncbi:hypothetical protein [Paraflavitalea speifideaquila]|uniref:hypothetical protein n=1 Tax=Paraflavitalea speifideaquila TaxID=3076558 RepID=UPI0028E75AED|nr:hypothetical protein [Paraflavitalea speifideiaquila]
MNQIQRIAFLLAMVAGMVITGCQKETSFETGNGGPLGPTAWAFKEGGNSFKGPIDTAYYNSTGASTPWPWKGYRRTSKMIFTWKYWAPILPQALMVPLGSF